MKKGYSILFFIIITISLFSCTNSDVENEDNNPIIINPLDAYQELNISYGDHEEQVFDLYLPANRTFNTKTIILIHGGGWTAGDKIEMNGIRDFLQLQFPDLAIVNINYRLADETNSPYPMQINDISAVVNYLKNNQNNYTISNELGFIGASAGAHLSLLWSYAFDTEKQTKMVCSIVGPTNFTDPAYSENESIQELLQLYNIEITTAYLEEISPLFQATTMSPPTILFYGGADPLVPSNQGTALHDKLNDLQVINQFVLYPNEAHGWTGSNLLDTTVKLKAFISTHLVSGAQ